MNRFLKQVFYFGLIGFITLLLLLVFYIATNPFKVIYTYDTYFENESKGRVAMNKSFVSTSTFLNNHKQLKLDYDSFIFGNSRSIFYEISEWEKHLPENANPFHIDGSSEAIWTVLKKLELIDKEGLEIKNALLVLDPATLLQEEPKTGHLFITPPALVNNKNSIAFHWTFFKTFSSPKFLIAFTDFKLSGTVKPYMTKNKLIQDFSFNYDAVTNEIRNDVFEDLIENNEYYTEERMAVFYERETIQQYHQSTIKAPQEEILNSIYNLLSKHKTDYKIIISPLYDQKKISTEDLKFLEELFGKQNVFDFSGINEFTNDYKNYYEDSHYRPHVATAILDEIYEKEE